MQIINGDALQHRGEPCWFRMQATLHSFQREAGAEPRGGRWNLTARPRSAHYWSMGLQRRKSEEEQQMDGEKRIWRKAGTTAKRKQEKERMRGTHPPPSYRSECPDCARSPPNILRMMIRNTPSRDGDILGDRHRARGRTVAPSSAITPPMVTHISLRWRHCELIEALDKRAHSAPIMRG